MENTNPFIAEAFQNLMGINGDVYVREINNTGSLCETSYKAICSNIKFNSSHSIIKYFGVVQWFYNK